MRVVFMGTPDFSVPALEEISKKHQVVGVVTQQDKPKGRGHKMQFPPVKEKAMELEIPVYQPQKVKNPEFLDILKKLKPDVIVVIAFGQILSKEILELPRFGCINVHASLLPKYRGAAPIQWAVIDGEEKSGVCTMYMEEGLDTGDILDVKEIILDKKETGGSLFDKLSKAGGELIVQTLEKLEKDCVVRKKQDDKLSTYAKKITKDLGEIDFSKSAIEIERLIRGLNPWPSAFTYMENKMLKIWEADVEDIDVIEEPGSIVEVTKKAIKVAAGNGYLYLKEIQLEGKKRMDVASFLNGYSITATKLGK